MSFSPVQLPTTRSSIRPHDILVRLRCATRMGLNLKAYLKRFHEMGERHYDFPAIEKRFAHLISVRGRNGSPQTMIYGCFILTTHPLEPIGSRPARSTSISYPRL